MRRLLLVVSAACGSVSDNKPDAATDAPPDVAPAAPGEYRWIRSLSSMQGYGVADGAGGLVVTGGITAPVNLGGGVLTPVGSSDMVVAGFAAADASHLYSVRHGAAGQEYPFLDTTDVQGAPLVHGVTYGDVDLGTGPLSGGGGSGADGYIGRYGPGAPAWLARLVGPGEDKISGSALGQGSTVWGAGWFDSNATTWNGGTLPTNGGRELFLARFNTATGAVETTKTYGGIGRDEGSSLASHGTTLVLGGFFDDTIAFGGTAQPITSAGLLDCFVVKLAADGTGIWARQFGGAGDDRDPQVAVDAAGDVYVAGSFKQQVAFGAINLVSNGGSDIFVAKLRGSDGSVAWAISIGSTGDDGASRIRVDAGLVALSGTLGGTLDGGTPAGGVDALVAGLEAATGAPRWRHVYATAGDERSFGLTIGRDGDVYALVSLGGEIDFGKPIIGPASPAAVLLRIAP
jgi:hypothetical protein